MIAGATVVVVARTAVFTLAGGDGKERQHTTVSARSPVGIREGDGRHRNNRSW